MQSNYKNNQEFEKKEFKNVYKLQKNVHKILKAYQKLN